jgi:hypothetical protein
MGNCSRLPEDGKAIQRVAVGDGKDLDDAVLTATTNLISDGAGRSFCSKIKLTFKGQNLPNLDYFSKTDA